MSALIAVAPSVAGAQTGVSDDRVSLPDGPGSIDGIGDGVSIGGNMGAMTYEVPIEVPRGFPGVTPELAFRYSSAAGSGALGIGWWLDTPNIARMTTRGLPEYVEGDAFVVDGSEELVRVARSGATATYRARFEGAFTRYTWHGVGQAGYWRAEHADGRVSYYGADSQGHAVRESRLEGSDGRTFRYMLVETVDVYGHRLRYDYRLSDGVPLLVRLGWVHDATGAPRHSVELEYEPRPDAISDCTPGFEELISERVAQVRVRARGAVVRSYRVQYESEATSGGKSRVARIERLGRDGGVYPVQHSFEYSQALGGVCADCERPFVVDMGTVAGSGIRTGSATLVDIDGDALPDLLDTSAPGAHRFYRNELLREGHAHFRATPSESQVATGNEYRVGLPYVQVLDVNGDGFADLINGVSGRVVCNRGLGDWQASGCGGLGSGLGMTLEDDPGASGEADPLRTRFMDVDGDRRIDVVRSVGSNALEVRLNRSTGFVSLSGAEGIGRELDRDRLQFADLNGDGLLDPVVVDPDGLVRFRLHYGRARWSEWITAGGVSLPSGTDQALADFQDLDGDGLDDLVVVRGSVVRYALNRSSGRFGAITELTSSGVDGGLPIRGDSTTVLFADMNGSGTTDVVWVETTGQVRYVELFPIRPNLMSRVENGLGMVHVVDYATSVSQQASDGEAWQFRLPHSNNVVSRTDTWVTLTGGENGEGLHEIVERRYRDGYYDGAEHRFRGYAVVETHALAETSRDSQEPSRTVDEYDVGAQDPYRAGLLVSSRLESGDEARPLRETRVVYGDCELAGIAANPDVLPPLGEPDVRFVCERERLTIHQEGLPAESWITTAIETAYDGYGNATFVTEHGVRHLGPPDMRDGCAPCEASAGRYGAACGPQCNGDERIEERTYVPPGAATADRWIVSALASTRSYAADASEARESRIHYDGRDFEGLEIGRLTQGRVTRVESRVSEGEWIDAQRSAYDAHGNVVATLDPLGAQSDETGHRRSHEYDEDHLRVVRTRVHLATPDGEPYRLVQEYAYEPSFDQVALSTGWMIEGLGASSSRSPTTYAYDEFGRVVGIAQPGDSVDAPTLEVAWELGAPASRIVVRRRTEPGGAPELESARCIDGRGRMFQELTRVGDGEWLASGFVERNRRGAEVRSYQSYTVASGFCATRPPEGVRATDVRYDGAGRELARRMPDADERGGVASERRIEYLPLVRRSWDENDLDEESDDFETPSTTRFDGLERPIAIDRVLRGEDGDQRVTIALFYDARGDLAGYVDALGHVKTQERDRLGRIVRIEDPSTGVVTLEHDAAGNVIARTDARGVTTRTEYDGANRPVARYDAASSDVTRIAYRYDFAPGCDAAECANGEGRTVEVRYPLPREIAELVGGDALGIDHASYDVRGRAVRQTRRLGTIELATETRYDGADRAVERRFPDGQEIVSELDGASRLVAIDGLIDRVEYDSRGLAGRVLRADGSEDVSGYDALLRPATRAATAGDGAVLQDLSYAHDRSGRLVSITEAAALGAGFGGASHFGHDSLGRLVHATIGAGTAEEETLSYAFDVADNILAATSDRASSSAHVGAYEYDDARPSIAIQVGELLQAHDDAGHLVARGDEVLEWDFLGRLAVARRGGEVTGVFAYGAGPERVAKREGDALTIYLGADFEVRDGVSRVYTRLGRDRLTRSQSTALGTVIYGDPDGDEAITAADAVFEPDARLRPSLLQASARRLLHEAAPEPVQLYHDHLGSIVAATRGGETIGQRRYQPFGEVRAERGFVDEHGYTGQERDASTGLLAFEWRYLDTRAGQWASADPAFEAVIPTDAAEVLAQSAGRFSYVGGAPLDRIDPDGLTWRSVLARIALYALASRLRHSISYFARVRLRYNEVIASIGPRDRELEAEGAPLEARARAAYDTRHDARLFARWLMDSPAAVSFLEWRDGQTHADRHGPSFERLVQQGRDRGRSDDAIYRGIIGSAQRSNANVNTAMRLMSRL